MVACEPIHNALMTPKTATTSVGTSQFAVATGRGLISSKTSPGAATMFINLATSDVSLVSGAGDGESGLVVDGSMRGLWRSDGG